MITRRHLLEYGAGGFLGALLARYAHADTQPAPGAKAKSMILLWMNGGPSHLESWDPKPGHANGGPTKAIKTSLPGLSVSEHMPLLLPDLKVSGPFLFTSEAVMNVMNRTKLSASDGSSQKGMNQ